MIQRLVMLSNKMTTTEMAAAEIVTILWLSQGNGAQEEAGRDELGWTKLFISIFKTKIGYSCLE